MSNRKLTQAIQGFFHPIGRRYRKGTKYLINWLFRHVLIHQRRGRLSTSGFILPTTVLLILVVALTVGALTFRAYTRNTQVIGEAQQRVIYNAATPAIDRARSKLEFLFDSTKDSRLPLGVPAQDKLEAMLLNNGKDRAGKDFPRLNYKDPKTNQPADPYTFPDEQRLDIDGKGGNDNAWWFRTDTDGDGDVDEKDSTIVYSVILNTPPQTTDSGTNQTKKIATLLLEKKDSEKANNLWVRQAPLSVDGALGCSKSASGGSAGGPDGWFDSNTTTAVLRKNFQVDALVIPGAQNATKVTLEFSQDRQLNRGNKWGAWFRHDLEIYPGAPFKWNGAMHTEGNLIVGNNTGKTDVFEAYLISSVNSCLYPDPTASEITVTDFKKPGLNQDLKGLVSAGMVRDGKQIGGGIFHLHSDNPADNKNQKVLNDKTGSSAVTNPIDITIDPEVVLLQDGYINRKFDATDKNEKPSGSDRNNRGTNENKANSDLPEFAKDRDNKTRPRRIYNDKQDAPYVDDLYRADDRWGPKPKYDSKLENVIPPEAFGQPIPASKDTLVKNEPGEGDTEAADVGLDGYWERRARAVGLRVLVGQRLELGNLFTWYAPRDLNGDGYIFSNPGADAILDQAEYEHEGDPLYPANVAPYPIANGAKLSHVELQRRTLRDNLSAVQSTAIYHSGLAATSNEKDYPVACLATTSHPGTLTTLRQSLTFRPFSFKNANGEDVDLLTNFFTGVGTNGWEFEPPAGSLANFKQQLAAGQPLRIALQNLANFAGDYNPTTGVGGAYPPTPNDTVMHPYPTLSMWGNFSNLKRALADLDSKGYDTLSVADKTYLQTAACSIGMLAYNIDRIQQFDPSNPANDKAFFSQPSSRVMAKLGRDLASLMDGINEVTSNRDPNGNNVNLEVLPRAQLKTYDYGRLTTVRSGDIEPSDYEKLPPEAFIGALRQYLLTRTGGNLAPDNPDFIDEMRMAEMIMLNHQIRRDRTFGFKPSPTFGRYTAQINEKNTEFLTACDPDQFTFGNGDQTLNTTMRSNSASLAKPSTVLEAGTLRSAPDADFATIHDPGISNRAISLAAYRLALSKLCGAIDRDSSGSPVVLPKFPALYYLFPEVEHDYDGDQTAGSYHDQSTTNEPAIVDFRKVNSYVASLNPQFKPVSTTRASGRAGFASLVFSKPSGSLVSRNPGSSPVFPIPDYSLSAVALTPRKNMSDWKLPNSEPRDIASNPGNFTPNLILIPDNNNGLKAAAIPFLDRAFFDGRQLMLTRTLDFDLGMLRSTQAGSKDVWLPKSGIVYAFREDAVREDAISRKACSGTNCKMNLENPTDQVDPPVKSISPGQTVLPRGQNGISTKSIDEFPDPDRRVHGFRLRNGSQVKRNGNFAGTGGLMNVADNVRGLSFFTDQPVYIQGDFNLHQEGNDNEVGNLLEEFNEPQPQNYNDPEYDDKFYNKRKTPNDNFAAPEKDRWRPSEILADSISILSNGFCDGTIADTFLQFNGARILASGFTSSYFVPDFFGITNTDNVKANRSYYHQPTKGLFDPGCQTAQYTSFHNQNRPSQEMSERKNDGSRNGWDWVRESSRYDIALPRRNTSNNYFDSYFVDFAAPIKISRTGHPFIARPRDTSAGDPPPANTPAPPLAPVLYKDAYPGINPYYGYGDKDNNGRKLIIAAPSRVNTIVVSGINPSRPNQGYGGLHNFPRFIECWKVAGGGGDCNTSGAGINLNFSGSFIQLSYTNYATAPFEIENIEPTPPAGLSATDENIQYYQPPNRLWGYDVALQFSTASPAVARFVTAGKNRNEFYVEPPANDPYIANLCKAVVKVPSLNLKTNCPE